MKIQCLATNSHIVLPSNGPRLWPVTNTEYINPPHMRRAPGRPKKLRNKSNDEQRKPGVLPRQLKTVKYKKCHKYGHNTRTCKGKSATDRKIPKGENKQKTTGKASSSGQHKNKKQKTTANEVEV